MAVASRVAALGLRSFNYGPMGFAAMPVVAALAVPCAFQYAGLPRWLRARASELALEEQDGSYADEDDTLQDTLQEYNASAVVMENVRSPGQLILDVFYPWNMLTVMFRNVMLSYAFAFNSYMTALLNHEAAALDAEQAGLPPPPAPPLPPLEPPFWAGAFYGVRELASTGLRRVYEKVAIWIVGIERAEPFRRNHRFWIQDVQRHKLAEESSSRKMFGYFFASLHGLLLHYAADWTISAALHTHSCVYRLQHLPPRKRWTHWAKGVGLHLARCIITLFTVSFGSALGALLWPSHGATIGTFVTDTGVAQAAGVYGQMLLAL